MDLIKVTPNKEKAKSILRMVDKTLEMINELSVEKYPSNIIKEYYDVIRELLSILLLFDGYKTIGEGAHKTLIDYIKKNYKQFSNYEIFLMDDLRITRNKIAYDGFFVRGDYVNRRKEDIIKLINKLKGVIEKK